jgi:hypothetical protein
MKKVIDGKEFDIYSPKQAHDLNIKFSPDWRNANKGDWIITEDDFVLKVLDRKEFERDNRKPIVYIYTGFGGIPTHYANLKAKKYDVTRGHGAEKIIYRTRGTINQREFVESLCKNATLTKDGNFTKEALIKAYMLTYSENNPNTAIVRARKIIKREWARKYMSQVMREQFKLINWDDGKVAREYDSLYNNVPKNTNLQFSVLNKISHLMDHNKEEKSGELPDSIMSLSSIEVLNLGPIKQFIALVEEKKSKSQDGSVTFDADFVDIIQDIFNKPIEETAQISEQGDNDG